MCYIEKMWSDEDLIPAAIILKKDATLKRKKRRFWVQIYYIREILKENAKHNLYMTKENDQYFRKTQFEFHELLSLIEPVITKQNNTFRESRVKITNGFSLAHFLISLF